MIGENAIHKLNDTKNLNIIAIICNNSNVYIKYFIIFIYLKIFGNLPTY